MERPVGQRAQPGRASEASAAARTGVVIAVLVAGTMAGCGWNPYPASPGHASADDPSPTAAAAALSPRTLVISPLTTIRRSETAQDTLVLHLVLEDGFGQPIKALGTLAVELRRSGPSAEVNAEGGPTFSSPAAQWQVDLRDPEVNAAAFDGLVTKTYVLRLSGVPGDTDPAAAHASPAWCTVRATFTAIDAGWGETRVLTAEARVAW
jgi:hypothetical protein